MYMSLWLYKWRVPIPPASFLSFCEPSDETLLSCTCYWEWGLLWLIWPTSSWTQLSASPHVGAVRLNSSCLDHRSLQGCQGRQLDSLWVVQRHGKESRRLFSTTLRGAKDAESCVCLGCPWRNWKQEGSTEVLWPALGVAELLLATSKGGTKPKRSCLPRQWRYKFMGKAIFSCSSYF